jgi:hypothetical protein
MIEAIGLDLYAVVSNLWTTHVLCYNRASAFGQPRIRASMLER